MTLTYVKDTVLLKFCFARPSTSGLPVRLPESTKLCIPLFFKNPCIDNFGFSVVMLVAVFIKSGLLFLFDAEGALDGNFYICIRA